jgi:double-stranded uracil-DNA glycosylase
MGERVTTLEDLLRPRLRAVCIGINPSPVSVEAGHYYQGRLGQAFFARLRNAGVLPARVESYEDDVAFAAGIGFTDIVKRPTRSAKEIRREEFEHGRGLLSEKLAEHGPELVIFTFKKTAQTLFGPFAGNGFLTGRTLAGSEVFVMPGPYESADTVARTMGKLAARFEAVGRTSVGSCGGPATGPGAPKAQ